MSDSEPEPDGFIIRGTSRDFIESHPAPKDVPLIIEVSDSTLKSDQRDKKRIYARAGIPIYWIINLVGRQVEVYSDPIQDIEQPTYRLQTIYIEKDDIPVMIDQKVVGTIRITDILP